MYSTKTGTVKATDGTEITLTVMDVDIDPDLARTIFDSGVETGRWHWKNKIWIVTPESLPAVQAAARFFYGWKDGSEKVYSDDDGIMYYEAWYAC